MAPRVPLCMPQACSMQRFPTYASLNRAPTLTCLWEVQQRTVHMSKVRCHRHLSAWMAPHEVHTAAGVRNEMLEAVSSFLQLQGARQLGQRGI